MESISLNTKNCIVTGEPAKVWSGHVIARGYGAIRDDGRMPLLTVSVTAGFASHELCVATKSDKCGCHGNWKAADGLMIDLLIQNRVLEQVACGDFVSIKTSLLKEIVQ